MKRMLEVCLVAMALVNGVTLFAQSSKAVHENSFQTRTSMGQPMQAGVHVELPLTSNAVPVPKADNKDSLVVAIAQDGTVYFGVEPMSNAELTEKLKAAFSNRTEKTLYVKADARTAYANLIKVLDAVRAAGVERLTFLTAQQNAKASGTFVLPQGFEMQVISPHSVAQNSSRAK